MGGSIHSKKLGAVLDPDNWIELSLNGHTERKQNGSNSALSPSRIPQQLPMLKAPSIPFSQLQTPKHLRNKTTGQEVLYYQVLFLDYQQCKDYLDESQFRQSHKKHLIAPKYIKTHKVGEMCNTNYYSKVYIEYVPLKMSGIRSISFADYLYILAAALYGFDLLFERYGFFEIDEDLIGITYEGLIKVWINSNYSKIWPMTYSFQKINLKYSPAVMIEQLLSIIESHVDWNTERTLSKCQNLNLISFSQYLKEVYKRQYRKQLSGINFQQCKQLLKKYSYQFHTQIPKYFVSIMKRIRAFQGIYQSEVESSNKLDDHFSFRESKVFSVKLGNLRFPRDYKGSIIVSESNQTYADRLGNDSQSKQGFTDRYQIFKPNELPLTQSNIRKSTANLLQKSHVSLQSNTGNIERSQPKRPYFTKYLQNKTQRRKNSSDYYASHISEQAEYDLIQSSFSVASLRYKEPTSINSSLHEIQLTKPLLKPIKVTFTYQPQPGISNLHSSDKLHTKIANIENRQLCPVETNKKKIKKQDKDLLMSPHTQTYTTDRQLDLDPEIVADLLKYSDQL